MLKNYFWINICTERAASDIKLGGGEGNYKMRSFYSIHYFAKDYQRHEIKEADVIVNYDR